MPFSERSPLLGIASKKAAKKENASPWGRQAKFFAKDYAYQIIMIRCHSKMRWNGFAEAQQG